VSVTGPGSGAVANPTGTVTCYDGGTAIGTGTLSGTATDTATFTTSKLTTATHTITAAYTSGDGNFNASPTSTSISQVVNKASTTTTVTASISSAVVGQPVTFNTTVTVNSPGSAAAAPFSGGGDFYDTTTMTDLGNVAVSSSGTAALTTSSLPPGGNTITATYSGDGNLNASGGTATSVIGNASIIVLDPSLGGALSLSGNASIKIPGFVAVDSSSTSALSASGNVSISASNIQVVAKVQKSGNATFSPAPTTAATAVADPFAALVLPSTSGLTDYCSASLSGNSSATIKPGIYSQITVSGNATLTLAAGIYIIEGGGLAVSGNASISGSGVMIVNAGSSYPSAGGTYGSIGLSDNGIANSLTLDSSPGTVAYGPAQIRSAYGLDNVSLDGTGQTIAIVDAYDNTSIYQALGAFDNQFGLTSAGPTLFDQFGPASSFLTVLNQNGQATSLPGTDPNGPGSDNWEAEEALDVEWAHAIASGSNGYSAAAGYNLVTGLGTPVANRLVADLVAYQGPGTFYAGPTVAPMQSAALVDTGTIASGPIDVFSVFDSIALTKSGLGPNMASGAGTTSRPSQAVGASRSSVSGQHRNIANFSQRTTLLSSAGERATASLVSVLSRQAPGLASLDLALVDESIASLSTTASMTPVIRIRLNSAATTSSRKASRAKLTPPASAIDAAALDALLHAGWRTRSSWIADRPRPSIKKSL